MKRYVILGLIALSGFLGFAGCEQPSPGVTPFSTGLWIDLSYPFSEETIYWPTAESFTLDTVFAGVTEKGFYYTAFKFCAAEHGGTHIDAPIHFAQGKQTVDQIPLHTLIAPAVVVDISEKALADRDYQITVKDFTEWEAQHGTLPDNVILLLRTGYGKFWPDRVRYMGTDRRGTEAVKDLHFPGLHPEAARWLVENRKINAVGLDTPSIDFGQSQLFESHQILFEQNIPVFENVANLVLLPDTGAYIVALPMKISGGSGGPLRIVAWIPSEEGE